MTRNLETADRLVRLVLAIGVTIFYSINVITGPFATVLLFLSIIVITIFIARVIFARIFMD